jgi:hypothetical protein
MLRVGRAYYTLNGKGRFHILAKKNRPSSNGCNFIGENTKTGAIVLFNHLGEHAWDKEVNLACDPFTWIGLTNLTVPAVPKFVKREDLKHEYSSYLRMMDGDPTTIMWMDRTGFNASYA